MKKLTLLATLSAIALMPVGAFAAEGMKKDQAYNQDGHDFSVKFKNTVKAGVNLQPQTFALMDSTNGERVYIEGQKIYLIHANGNRNFAPNGPYTVQGGTTFFALDGLVEHTESPEEIFYVDSDMIDTHHKVTKNR